MTTHIVKTQQAFFALYESTKRELAELEPQKLQIIASEAGDVLTTSQLYSERVAAETVQTACRELLNQL